MRSLILLAVVTLAYGKTIEQRSARGYNRRVAIPLGEEIRKQEEKFLSESPLGRIAGGSSAALGKLPYQAGVLTQFIGVNGTGVCGASLVSTNRAIYAAHCWFDGNYKGNISEIVLGSTTLFFGGTRQSTSIVFVHPHWDPDLYRNDVAVIYLSDSVKFSKTIAPIALPSGSQLKENFTGEVAVASGFGRTGDTKADELTLQQTLSYVNLSIIDNTDCKNYFPKNVVDSNICTSGTGNTSACSGDSGGPLAVTKNGQPVLIGMTSFGSHWGCQLGFPVVYARVSSFMSFFNQHL